MGLEKKIAEFVFLLKYRASMMLGDSASDLSYLKAQFFLNGYLFGISEDILNEKKVILRLNGFVAKKLVGADYDNVPWERIFDEYYSIESEVVKFQRLINLLVEFVFEEFSIRIDEDGDKLSD
jgi:hypothetical protein